MAVGIASRSVSTVVTFPIYRAVALLQVEGAAPALGMPPKPYKGGFFGFLNVIKQTNSSLGWRANWRGAPFAAVAIAFTTPLGFVANDFVKSAMRNGQGDDGVKVILRKSIMAGVLSAAITLPFNWLAAWPVMLAKVDLRPDGVRFPAHRHFRALLSRPGLTASLMARAVPVSLLGTAVHRGLYFGLYDTFKFLNPMRDDHGAAGMLSRMGVGYGSSLGATFAAYPMAVVCNRFVVANVAPLSAPRASSSSVIGIRESARRAMAGTGVWGLYRGFKSQLTYVIAGGFALVFYDSIKDALMPQGR
jgi:solute carrier family 25 (adenine nucleotide translocator) protein 4/5/6/31